MIVPVDEVVCSECSVIAYRYQPEHHDRLCDVLEEGWTETHPCLQVVYM